MLKNTKNAIIGPSGIGRVHLRELINFGFQNIYLLGKNIKQKEQIHYLKSIKILIFLT